MHGALGKVSGELAQLVDGASPVVGVASHADDVSHHVVGETAQPSGHGLVGVSVVEIQNDDADQNRHGGHGHDQRQVDSCNTENQLYYLVNNIQYLWQELLT